MNKPVYLRGDIYYADLGEGFGSEQQGCRPVVIIQNNIGNKYSPTVIVAAISSKPVSRKELPTHCYIGSSGGLDSPSIVLLEQVRTIDKSRLKEYIGHLEVKYLKALNSALTVSLSLYKKDTGGMTLNLCKKCADNFRYAGDYILHRTNPNQEVMECCTYCNKRDGYEYFVMKK